MRNKKLFSTVMATTLAVTTMAMPVMATEGGQLDVDLSNKTAVMRVQVPTKMAVMIDQYGIDEEGCQIACADVFEMKNLSEMPVKVVVDSTVSLKSDITLASGKEAAIGSASGDVAWLAVAAQTASGDVYDDKKTTGTTETVGTLNEANANVTTFEQSGDAGTAKQTFYLQKGTGTASYKMVTSGDAAKVKFARFYELGEEITSGDAVKEKLKETDVYVASGDVVEKYEKGTETITFTNGTHKGYVISGDTDATGNGKYIYGELGVDPKGEAAFRYVGNLSAVNGEQWSKEKIKGIHISYDITGETAGSYSAVADDCTYGLYAAVTGPQISVTQSGLISVNNLTAEQNYSAIEITVGDGSKWDINADGVTWNDSTYSASTGGYFSVQLGDSWMNFIRTKGGTATIVLKLTDQTEKTVTLTL